MAQNNPKPKIMVENISCVLPQQSQLGGLFLGNVYGAQNPTILKEYGIRAVLTSSIQTDINYSFKDIPFHMKIQAHDKQNYNLKEHINKCIDFIQKARQFTNVYVHCFAGVSRSVAIVCAYIMWKLKWNYQTTIAFVKAKRIVAKPNQGFIQQLMQIQQIILGGSSYISSQSSKLQEINLNANIQPYSKNQMTSNIPAQYQYNQQYNKNLIKNESKKQNVLQTRASSSLGNNYYGQNQYYPNNIKQQFNPNINPNNNIPYQINKSVYLPQNYYLPNQMVNQQYTNENTVSNNENRQQQTKNDKFLYLKNFFPQNYPAYNNDIQLNQLNNMKVLQNNQKISVNSNKNQYNQSMSSSAQNWMSQTRNMKNLNKNVQNGQRQSQNLHKMSIKNTTNNNNNQSSSYLVLGGKKNSLNHTTTPIPKVSQRKQYSTNNLNQQRVSESIPQTNTPYKIQTDNYYPHRGSLQLNGNLSPRINEYNWKSNQLFQNQNKFYNQSVPSYQNIYNSKFDFNKTAPSQGFFTNNRNSAQKKEAQKTASRILVRPKDLPGYKNY